MKTLNKLVFVFFLFATLLAKADIDDMPVPGGGGTGGHGTGGSPSSPIDMYVYLLSVVAVAFIIFYTKKYKKIKA
ncbi:signal peptidase [Chryseobacterium pennipullorum]|uniref:Signal peptidase n=1 Tax=Chryseobacterium pennipullorum TaxID=2258963 RepID=A0A3D9AY69_9FLAO|nr:signal peptidase [Chryseobacterium pennipullorum]REC46264.1 signal peptidase [Chryseobacterium pennipullorum]